MTDDDDLGHVTSVRLWREDKERIEALKRAIEARSPGARVNTNLAIRTAIATASTIAAMPGGTPGQDAPLFTIVLEPMDRPPDAHGRPVRRVSIKRRKRKAKEPAG
jgi:hypothetical protein